MMTWWAIGYDTCLHGLMSESLVLPRQAERKAPWLLFLAGGPMSVQCCSCGTIKASLKMPTDHGALAKAMAVGVFIFNELGSPIRARIDSESLSQLNDLEGVKRCLMSNKVLVRSQPFPRGSALVTCHLSPVSLFQLYRGDDA